MTREVASFSWEKENSYWQNRYIVENFDKAMKNGWIKVFYHALYRMESQKIAAFEGLARWIDQFQSGYYVAGNKVGKAWNAGKDLMKK